MNEDVKSAMPDYSWDIKSLRRDLEYVNEDIRKINKKIKIIVAILLENKLIGEAMQKAIEETEIKNDNSFKVTPKNLKWLLEN